MNLQSIAKRFIKFGKRDPRLQSGYDCIFEHQDYEGGDLVTWIEEGIQGYKQWYQPVRFDENLIAHVTTPPNWDQDPGLDKESGIARWEHIVKRNIPDVKGKRVLDVGCNVGVFSIELSRLGAREVIGLDRDLTIPQKPDFLPRQNIVRQAEFVRDAISLKTGENLKVRYVPCNVADYQTIEALGKFDLIMALNVVYHELDKMEKLLETLASLTNSLILQTTLAHGSPIKEWAEISTHIEILTKLGFTKISIDAPVGYLQPVILATR